jgi:preprotein translocase subunit SecD
MKLATRVRAADPLAGRLPEELSPPPVQVRWAPEPAPARAPRARWVAAVVAAACLAVIGLAVAFSSPSPNGFSATLRAGSAAQASASAGVLRERVATLGLHGWSVQADGDRVQVACTGCSPALARGVTQPGELRIYDWETNVLGARCGPMPEAGDMTSGGVGHGAAVRRAAHCPGSRVLRADNFGGAVWYVLRDRPALTGRDVAGARLLRLADGAPAVRLRFTPDGESRWRALTRRVARRGLLRSRPGENGMATAQHVAIALDHRLLVTPYIDPLRNPDGLRGLEIAGGLTTAQARTLVAQLHSGALPTAAP